MSARATTHGGGDTKAHLFIGAVTAAGAAILMASLLQVQAAGLERRHLAWLGLAVLTLAVGPLSVRLPLPNCRVSFSDSSIFLVLLSFGPDFATLTAALDGLAASTRQGGAWYKRAFNTAGMAISVSLSSRVFTRLLPEAGVWDPGLTAFDLVLPIVALVITQYLGNTALVSTVVALKERASLVAIWQEASPWAGAAYVVGSVAAAIVFFAVREQGIISVFALLPFPAVLYLAYRACLNRVGRMKGATTV